MRSNLSPAIYDLVQALSIMSCDASEVVFAAAAIIRALLNRLMPLKTVSIPRGELMAYQLAVRLAKCLEKCESDISLIPQRHCGESRKFCPYVTSRVAEILSESDST